MLCFYVSSCMFFFFKQKTAYELRISDWSSDVCSSDLHGRQFADTALDLAERVRQDEIPRHFQIGLFPVVAKRLNALAGSGDIEVEQIGRASCGERVCQYV